ncbi:MAG: DUF4256 domain-containing protein [Bacteroidota bacterium]
MSAVHKVTKELSTKQKKEIFEIIKARFENNMNRHKDVDWKKIQAKLEANEKAIRILIEMENTGGEPDVVKLNKTTGQYIFVDCCEESPKERRSLCYDATALDNRKENKPRNNAVDMSEEIGIEILTEKEYRELQKLGKFDLKTSSWVKTPEEIRKLGGAIFCDRRYDKVFTYHNGAESYYASRGFRGKLKI